jgi:hypothetical protein
MIRTRRVCRGSATLGHSKAQIGRREADVRKELLGYFCGYQREISSQCRPIETAATSVIGVTVFPADSLAHMRLLSSVAFFNYAPHFNNHTASGIHVYHRVGSPELISYFGYGRSSGRYRRSLRPRRDADASLDSGGGASSRRAVWPLCARRCGLH